LLMVSVGMSLRPRIRRMAWRHWAGWVLAFIVPAALVLLPGRILPLQPAERAGLFFVGAALGARLMTRKYRQARFRHATGGGPTRCGEAC
jgi:4-hydroxybenzoate polyprenyltransferase